MTYTSMLFALGFDKLVFGQTPGLMSIIGSTLILGSAVYMALQRDGGGDENAKEGDDVDDDDNDDNGQAGRVKEGNEGGFDEVGGSGRGIDRRDGEVGEQGEAERLMGDLESGDFIVGVEDDLLHGGGAVEMRSLR